MDNQYQQNIISHSIEQQHGATPPHQYHGGNINKDSTPYSSKLQSTVIYTSDQGPGSHFAFLSFCISFTLHFPNFTFFEFHIFRILHLFA